jgi:hypothetical protein
MYAMTDRASCCNRRASDAVDMRPLLLEADEYRTRPYIWDAPDTQRYACCEAHHKCEDYGISKIHEQHR